MSAPSPDPSDPDAVSAALDDLEERVVGRRVDPPQSADLAGDTDAPEGTQRDEADDGGSGTEPSD